MTVTPYGPPGNLSVGQEVELAVTASVWQGKSEPRYSLVMSRGKEGEF